MSEGVIILTYEPSQIVLKNDYQHPISLEIWYCKKLLKRYVKNVNKYENNGGIIST